jgi:hypothetical protein
MPRTRRLSEAWGNVYSADGWDEVLKPVVARYRGKVSRIYSEPTPALPIPRSMSFSKPNGSNMLYVCRQTASCKSGSDICSNAPLVARPMMCADHVRASPIRLEAGRNRAGLSPRSNGIRANFIRAWA